MRAMVLKEIGKPLELKDVPEPEPEEGQVKIRVHACGVCRTDLHIFDGDLDKAELPLIMGHEIVGEVVELGGSVGDIKTGDRIGVPWLGWTCGECKYCRSGRENLCKKARFTGYQINGGYSEYTIADHRYCFKIPEKYEDVEAAPLLCAGLIGYRSYRMAGVGEKMGLYGFGASAHILAQVAKYEGWNVYAFTRPGDREKQKFAEELGSDWAGGSLTLPPDKLDAAIIFAPAGHLIPQALKSLNKNGRVVCAGIHMSDIPKFPYKLLWEERCIKSVANLTRRDGEEFFELAPRIPVTTETTTFKLEEANEALRQLREGKFRGAAVLKI